MSLIEPRYKEFAETIRGSVVMGDTWGNPPQDVQWSNLRGMFGDKTEALLVALWGDIPWTAGHLAAIFNNLGGRERPANVAKLLRFAEGSEAPSQDELFPEEKQLP